MRVKPWLTQPVPLQEANNQIHHEITCSQFTEQKTAWQEAGLGYKSLKPTHSAPLQQKFYLLKLQQLPKQRHHQEQVLNTRDNSDIYT